MTTTYQLRAYVDWDGDGDYEDAHELIEEMLEVSTARGRSGINDEVAAGTASIKAWNRGEYNRRNTDSPIYGKVLPDRAMYLEVEIEGYETLRLFTGQTASIGNSHTFDGIPSVTISCGDALDKLRRQSIRTDILEDVRIDEAVDAVLDAAGWPALARDLDVSTITLDRAWWYRANPLEALTQLSKDSLGGHVFALMNGDVAFRDFTWRTTQPVHMQLRADGTKPIEAELRREDFIDKVRIKRAGLDVAIGNTALFTLSPTGRIIYTGSARVENTWKGQYSVAGKNVIEPVPYTDYTFNSEPDGSGVDKTAQVTVADFTSFGGGYQIVWDNLDASPSYCTFFQIRGQAVRRSNDERTIEVDAISPVVSGQEWTRDLSFNDQIETIVGYANWRASTANSGQTRITLQRTPWDNQELYQLCTLDFGSRVELDFPAYDIEGDWFVEKVQVAWPRSNGTPPTFSLVLFPADMVGGNLFRISGDGDDEYSLIAPDAATEGYDRIAY